MADFIDVSNTGDLMDGQMKKVMAGDREILIANVAGKYYATQNRCSHMGGNLSGGILKGTVVTCPLHHSQYDLKDGHVIRWTDWNGLMLMFAKTFKPPKPLKTYEVRVQNNKVQVMIDQK